MNTLFFLTFFFKHSSCLVPCEQSLLRSSKKNREEEGDSARRVPVWLLCVESLISLFKHHTHVCSAVLETSRVGALQNATPDVFLARADPHHPSVIRETL